jgi:hypothetical protein
MRIIGVTAITRLLRYLAHREACKRDCLITAGREAHSTFKEESEILRKS